MNLISSSVSTQKYLKVPLAIVLGIGILIWRRSGITNEPISFFAITVYVTVIIAILHFIYKYWLLMDRVWDSGTSLTFMRNGKKEELLYSQIKSFNINTDHEYDEGTQTEFFVKVHFVKNTKWGTSLRFMPATEGNVGRKPIAEIYEIETNINRPKN